MFKKIKGNSLRLFKNEQNTGKFKIFYIVKVYIDKGFFTKNFF